MDFFLLCYLEYSKRGQDLLTASSSLPLIKPSSSKRVWNETSVENIFYNKLFFISDPKEAILFFFFLCIVWFICVMTGLHLASSNPSKKCLDWARFQSYGLALDNPVYYILVFNMPSLVWPGIL